MARKLTSKQLAFCDEYLVDLNGTQAAVRAGYSKKTANRIASNLLSKVDIQIRIRSARSQLSLRTEMTQDEVMAEFRNLAFSNLADLFDQDGNLLELKDMRPEVQRTIQAMETITTTNGEFTTTRQKIKLHGKQQPLNEIGKRMWPTGKHNNAAAQAPTFEFYWPENGRDPTTTPATVEGSSESVSE